LKKRDCAQKAEVANLESLQGIKMINVGLVIVATNKYIRFVKPLYDSMQHYFLNEPDIRRQMFLFTDQKAFDGPVVIHQEHEPWPNMTLKRYEIFDRNREVFREMDYLYHMDADMIFLEQVGREILGERVATVHPAFWILHREYFPYETNPQSKACIRMDEGDFYFAGGFNGGKHRDFLEMVKVIADNVHKDLENGYIAVWHDESHLNRYLIAHKPTVILDPSYCFPEAKWAQMLPFPKIIMALDKDHEALRR
jgi:histo-blood group ABO system transferase